jgi:predicted PurR-regulated permease PerM
MSEIRIADPLRRRIIYTSGILCALVLGAYTIRLAGEVLSVFFSIFAPFLISLVIAYTLAPAVIFLQKKLKFGRLTGTAILYIISFIMVIVLLAILVPTVLSELADLLDKIKLALPVLLERLAKNRYFKIDTGLIETI